MSDSSERRACPPMPDYDSEQSFVHGEDAHGEILANHKAALMVVVTTDGTVDVFGLPTVNPRSAALMLARLAANLAADAPTTNPAAGGLN